MKTKEELKEELERLKAENKEYDEEQRLKRELEKERYKKKKRSFFGKVIDEIDNLI
jgi:hypothetical protein